MQQAYRALRVIAEAQTVRIVLSSHPDELILQELCIACASFTSDSSRGIKAVVLDFDSRSAGAQFNVAGAIDRAPTNVGEARAAVYAVAQPVLAVVRDTPSVAACELVYAADLTLVADDAVLLKPEADKEDDTLPGSQACRLRYVTWSVPASDINKEMERVLDLLRAKSAIALRQAKASVRLAQAANSNKLAALQRVNEFYLAAVMRTADAHEGLKAFLEKRKPIWKNM